MQEHNQQIVNEFLSHSKEINEDIMADIEKMLGVMPFIFKSLMERPDIFMLATLADYKTGRPKTLSPKTAELVAIAAAAGAGAESCLKVHIKAALNEGVTRDEILDTIMIAAMMGKTKILASSLRLLSDGE
ncbi:carboxymuconolactone decarboxylase family protein [Methanospirillum sp.]|uniref:carboxymuconolactone decarboxylase family protein n=1 Tax=Methanospirillum sp. TaxID=45200 RepID=UPI00359F4CD2